MQSIQEIESNKEFAESQELDPWVKSSSHRWYAENTAHLLKPHT